MSNNQYLYNHSVSGNVCLLHDYDPDNKRAVNPNIGTSPKFANGVVSAFLRHHLPHVVIHRLVNPP